VIAKLLVASGSVSHYSLNGNPEKSKTHGELVKRTLEVVAVMVETSRIAAAAQTDHVYLPGGANVHPI